LGTFQAIAPKYVISTSFEIEGVVEKSDVIGALFGQTEGLFGPELDLHELQKTGRIGRIEIKLKSKKDKTNGQITIPSSLDKPLTALIAAAIENVDRVGPCAAKVTLDKIEDVRAVRRDTIIKRAKEILHKWTIDVSPGTDKISTEIAKAIRPAEIVSYGPEKLPAGPDIKNATSLIIVEGRADVAALLKSGLKNVIAVEGTKIPATIIKLSKEKEITALLDGDRGGDMILEGLLQVAKPSFVARAPRGKEVEELTPKEVTQILHKKTPINKLKVKKTRTERKARTEKTERKEKKHIILPEIIVSLSSELEGTLEAVVLNDQLAPLEKMPVSELCIKLKNIDNAHTIVFDGVITQRLIDIACDKGVKRIVGERTSGIVKRPLDIQLLTFSNIKAS
jgi:DNA primase